MVLAIPSSPAFQHASHLPEFPPSSRNPIHERNSAMDPEIIRLWTAINKATTENARSRQRQKTFSVDQVRPNNSGIACADNDQVIRVAAGPNKELVPIHAHRLMPAESSSNAKAYAVGQSPPVSSCTQFILQGIASGQGLFQFVSQRMHSSGVEKKDKSVISMLKKQLNECVDKTRNGQTILGGRYAVVDFKKINGFDAVQDHEGERTNPNDDYLRYKLEFTDLLSNQNPAPVLSIPITQAGLKFTGAVLAPTEIARASKLVDDHISALDQFAPGDSAAQRDPLMLSHAGYGRNATLITYRHFQEQITSGKIAKSNLDQALTAFILDGRQTRDPNFVHSIRQFASLRAALQQCELPTLRSQDLGKRGLYSPGLNKPTESQDPTFSPRSKQPDPSLQTAASDLGSKNRGWWAWLRGIKEPAAAKELLQQSQRTVAPTVTELPSLKSTGATSSSNRVKVESGIVNAPIALVRTDQNSSSSNPDTARLRQLEIQKGKFGSGKFLPEKLAYFYKGIMDVALRRKSTANPIVLPAKSWESTSAPPTLPMAAPSLLDQQAAALAIATVTRDLKRFKDQTPQVHFECTDARQQEMYEKLLVKADILSSHVNYEALQRTTINKPTQASTIDDFNDPHRVATYVPGAITTDANGMLTFGKDSENLPESLNNIKFSSWDGAPITNKEWEQRPTGLKGEPPLPSLKECRRAAGVVIREDDGRIWIVAPTNQFQGLDNTFPKGQHDPDLPVQVTACKEAYEESGLQVELIDFLCDVGKEQATRYYLARRIGGTPRDVGWESQGVRLAPLDEVLNLFKDNPTYRDVDVFASLKKKLGNSYSSQRVEDQLASLKTTDEYRALLEQLHVFNTFEPHTPLSKEFDESVQNLSRTAKKSEHIGGRRPHELISKDVDTRKGNSQLRRASGLTWQENCHIHANRMPEDADLSRRLIAAQRPRTYEDHQDDTRQNMQAYWKAALRADVKLMVDLTQEGEKKGELPYAPTNEHPQQSAGDLTLASKRQQTQTDDEGIQLQLDEIQVTGKRNDGSDFTTDISRLHFKSWKDGTTIEPEALIALADQVSKHSKKDDRVLIHCSHGVGRTGTLITFMTASDRIGQAIRRGIILSVQDFLDITLDVLMAGRQERGHMFVANNQFPLVLDALLKKHFKTITFQGNLIARR